MKHIDTHLCFVNLHFRNKFLEIKETVSNFDRQRRMLMGDNLARLRHVRASEKFISFRIKLSLKGIWLYLVNIKG